MNDFFLQDIKFLKGVGPSRAEMLNKELGIYTFRDLLYYFPYKYIDRTKIHRISEINSTLTHIQIKGKITTFYLEGNKYKPRLHARFTDGTGEIELIWFQGLKWVQKNYQVNTEYIVFGKPALFNKKISLAHPEIEKNDDEKVRLTGYLQPQYSITEKLKNKYINSRTIQKLIINLLEHVNKIQETIPEYIRKKYKLIGLSEALRYIHLPPGNSQLKSSTYRLKFEELFFIQLHILFQKANRKKAFKGFIFKSVGDYFNTFYKQNLSFELTDAQKRVIKEIRYDLGSGKQMNRLLQGDVGSGKTLVALMAMLLALDNGYQACLMAPTEILARQHYSTISNFLKKIDVHIQILTGTTTAKERKVIFDELRSGRLYILIGTHALLEDPVQFDNLGLVVIDEQHRFGVAQRAALWKKNVQPPHVLVMTATPIPRTLAMTLYGDLDVSVIDEMPPGRKGIKTYHYYDSKRLAMFGFLREQIKLGRQIYVVYPLISESEALDYKDLEDGYEGFVRAFPPPDYTVVCVHGKMKPADKEEGMQLFKEKKAQILIATTVIEVGVDIPNASVMIIESAERFGLSQLHQLRGRVGRGAEQSYCILMTGFKLSAEARKRIETMVNTNDGFEIAEVDLKLRGPGDVEGTQQSGLPFDLKIAHLGKDGQLLQLVRQVAEQILDEDAELGNEKNALLKKNIRPDNKITDDWSVIS
jgi:ATP-dependent DNA helicase RecG